MSGLQVFVLIDALGWEILQQQEFLRRELPHRTKMRTLLGFSSGIIPSMLTGRTPAETGVWNLVYRDPLHSPFRWLRHLPFLTGRVLDNRLGRRLLTEFGRRVLGLGSGFDCCVPPQQLPYFNWAETGNIYAEEGIPGNRSIFDELAAQGIAYRSYSYTHGMSDREILARAARDIAAGEEKFYFLYLCEMDMFLHLHVNQPEKIAEQLSWYEEELRKVFAAARERNQQAQLCLFSDHGMTPVTRHFDLEAVVRASGCASPRDYLAVYDSTMARVWFFSDAARHAITQQLSHVDCGRVLSEAEIRRLGVYFADQRYGELLLVMDPGVIIAGSGFNSHGWKPQGMHGYHPDDPQQDASLLSNRPLPRGLATVCDIYGVMQEALR